MLVPWEKAELHSPHGSANRVCLSCFMEAPKGYQMAGQHFHRPWAQCLCGMPQWEWLVTAIMPCWGSFPRASPLCCTTLDWVGLWSDPTGLWCSYEWCSLALFQLCLVYYLGQDVAVQLKVLSCWKWGWAKSALASECNHCAPTPQDTKQRLLLNPMGATSCCYSNFPCIMTHD